MPLVIEKPYIQISADLLRELQSSVHEMGQVIIHGICKTQSEPTFIRIWPSTYLFDQHSSHVSELVHFEHISGFPVWTKVLPHREFAFTLIFGGLPSSCTMFDLQEVIPQANGFYVPSIMRNEQDVYYLDFSM